MGQEIKKVSKGQHLVILVLVALGLFFAFKNNQIQPAAHPESAGSELYNTTAGIEPITPIPQKLDLDERKVALGERLYHDPRLSKNNTISCASCHDLKKGGTDQVQYSTGVNQALGGINSPTTFNSGFLFAQFWDGRAETLAEQAAGPVHNPIEMGSDWPKVIGKLSTDPDYVKAFSEIYPDGMNGRNITDAIAVFEQSLYTPDSRFDLYLRGNKEALTRQEQEGYRLFKEFGCVSCHQGLTMGGNMYQNIGVMEDYFVHRPITKEDLGRFNVTRKEGDKFQFKVPTLRNIAITYPYLHDGSARSLEDVLTIMWKNQLGRSITEEESSRIVLFLKTLTGTYRGEHL